MGSDEAALHRLWREKRGEVFDFEERLDGLIEKKIKQLVVLKEVQRQYFGQDSTAKFIEGSSSPIAK
jgi:hypothetical protein